MQCPSTRNTVRLYENTPKPVLAASVGHILTEGADKGNGKAVLLEARSGPEGSRKLRFPDFMTTAQDSGKVVSLTHRSPLPPGNAPGTHFC